MRGYQESYSISVLAWAVGTSCRPPSSAPPLNIRHSLTYIPLLTVGWWGRASTQLSSRDIGILAGPLCQLHHLGILSFQPDGQKRKWSSVFTTPKGTDPALSLASAGEDELHGPSESPGVGKAGLGIDPGSEPERSHRVDSAEAGKVGRPHLERRLRRPVHPQAGSLPLQERRGGWCFLTPDRTLVLCLDCPWLGSGWEVARGR